MRLRRSAHAPFFTLGDTEARSWTLRQGQTALDAAESIHSDIARGFIRCEVIRWDDLLETGSHAGLPAGSSASRRQELCRRGREDVLNVRFNL